MHCDSDTPRRYATRYLNLRLLTIVFSGIGPAEKASAGKEHGLISRTAVGNRAYFSLVVLNSINY